MSSHLRFDDDEAMNTYEPSDSEDEYNENEKRLLKNVRNRRKEYSDSEDEVLGVRSESSSDDDKSDIALSDIEGQEDRDDLPDARAWGKEKKKFYGADYVDPDYGGFEGKDAHSAAIEEEEARNLQNQLAQQLDDGDFSLDVFFQKPDKEKEKQETIEEKIKTDISHLSKKEKLQILQKESPELLGLIEDFEAKMTLAKENLQPVLQKYRKGQIPNSQAIEFVQTQYQLILNYGSNIYMYLLLKINKELQNHPVIKRLYQYRQLLAQMDPVYEEIIKPQIEILLSDNDNADADVETTTEKKKVKAKTLKVLANLLKESKSKKKKSVTFVEEQPSKKIKLDKAMIESNKKEVIPCDESDNYQNGENLDETEETEQGEEEVGKRAITYQMAKNKGLTPHRKKELRNPRVKHKLKFRKAVIRRKGAVREPRKELRRYDGEISGIKASVSKSIKIKS